MDNTTLLLVMRTCAARLGELMHSDERIRTHFAAPKSVAQNRGHSRPVKPRSGQC
jgi:hypothetical protein